MKVYDATFNPFNIKAVTVFVSRAQANTVPRMEETPISGQERNAQYVGCCSKAFNSKPSIRTLPLEIVLMIAEKLSIQDLLNFWIASPNVPDYFPQKFWRSRFEHGMEFGHVFEFTELWHNPNAHWYTLFLKARELESLSEDGPALRSRRRILPVVDLMVELTSNYIDRPVEGQNEQPLHPILLETDGFSAHQMQLTLPLQITSLRISFVQLGSRRYISGLRLNNDTSGLGSTIVPQAKRLKLTHLDLFRSSSATWTIWGFVGSLWSQIVGGRLVPPLSPPRWGNYLRGVYPLGSV